MAVEILWDPAKQIACMWDNTTDQAFGPVFSGSSAGSEVQEFLDWLKINGQPNWAIAVTMYPRMDAKDPRNYSAAELMRLVQFWCELPTEVQ